MLAGETITLRPVQGSDAQRLLPWYNDPTFWGPYFNVHPYSEDTLEQRFRGGLSVPDWHEYLIIASDTGEPVGIGVFFNPFTISIYQAREIAYVVHPTFRRQGIGRQAACLLVNHLFDATPIERVQANVPVGNEASCRVAEGAGMEQEGICRRVLFLHGRYVDFHVYSITREEWREEASYRAARPPF